MRVKSKEYGEISCTAVPLMSALEMLAHLTQIARGDIGEFIDDHGRITLKKGNIQLVKHYKKRGNAEEIELFSALEALKMLAQYHGLIDKHLRRKVNMATVKPVLAEIN